MRTKLFAATILLLLITAKSYAQPAFGVSPWIGFNSAYFGFKINNKIVPFIGFQYLKTDARYTESGERYDYSLNQVVSYTDEETFTGNLYIPDIGVKYFIKQKNKINAYFLLCVARPFASLKEKDSDPFYVNNVDSLKKTNILGGEAGFGVEYFFDENFSVGGEFGLKYLRLCYKYSYDDIIYDPYSMNDKIVTIETKYTYNLMPTYSKISFNYYF